MHFLKYLVGILLLGTLVSCSSHVKFSDYYEESFSISSEVKVANLKNAQRIALILPPDGKPLNWGESSLVKTLEKNDFGIIITKNHSQNELIDKDTWISYAYSAYMGLRIDSMIPFDPEKLLIIAFEDAGHTLPKIGEFLQPDFYIAVNTGAFNPLKELEFLIEDTTVVMESFFESNNVLNKEELLLKIDKLKNNTDLYATDLGYKNNNYWLSFYGENLFETLKAISVPGVFVYSEDYPRLRKINKAFMEPMIPPGPLPFTTVTIAGEGDFSREVEMDRLTEIVNKYINSLR